MGTRLALLGFLVVQFCVLVVYGMAWPSGNELNTKGVKFKNKAGK